MTKTGAQGATNANENSANFQKKNLPIGISDYKKLVDEDYYYIDKTLFIKELMEQGGEVTLIPRPRRFGKTLNLSMLHYFFEKI